MRNLLYEVLKMSLFNFHRKRKKREETNLRNTSHEEMFKALREEGGIVSIEELSKTNQLTTEILSIWDETIKEMFLLSLDPEKVRLCCDTSHLYFITHTQYNNWDYRLKIFMDTLACLNSLNSLSIVNSIGCLIYLNPLGEPVDDSHDEAIRKMFEDFGKKAAAFSSDPLF